MGRGGTNSVNLNPVGSGGSRGALREVSLSDFRYRFCFTSVLPFHDGGTLLFWVSTPKKELSIFTRHCIHRLFRILFMKQPLPRDDDSRFAGRLRHYHRSNTQPTRSWDDWVDGRATQTTKIPWLRGILITVAVLGLLAVLVGLFIEMR